MPKVIDAFDYIKNKKKLPTEAFFVDTNIIIAFADPFSLALTNPSLEERYEKINQVLQYFKSIDGTRSYSTIVNCLEYYKHIQVNYYNIQTNQKYNSLDFKNLLDTNTSFANGWQKQISVFERLFYKKNFQVIDSNINQKEIIQGFGLSGVDFGDFTTYKIVMSQASKYRCIFSNDKDFYSLPDDFYFVTIRKSLIEKAKAEGKLFT